MNPEPERKKRPMSKITSIEEGAAAIADIDFLLENIISTKSASSASSKKKKNCSKRKPKLKNLDGSRKPSKVSSRDIKSTFRNTLSERSTADERLRAFMNGELALDGKTYDPNEGKQYTLEEIGRVMNVSRERVRQIEEHSLRKLWRLLDIMSKRENLKQDDWLGIFDNGNSENTVYFP